MNDAHWHLVVNHFPIIGIIFGLGILIVGFIMKNKTVKNTAFVLFIIAAVFGFASMYTGERAEEMVEDMPNVGHQIIHEHEELAEKLAILLYALAIISLGSLYAAIKKHKLAKVLSIVTLILAVVAVVLATKVATSGGEIRHTEIRVNTLQTPIYPYDKNVQIKNEKREK